MNIMQSWKDSLAILLPKNLKLFALVTLKSIVDCFKVLLRYWGWFIVLFGGVTFLQMLLWYIGANKESLIMIAPYLPMKFVSLIRIVELILVILGQFFIFITILCTRPSIEKKDINYFKKYIPYFGYILIVVLSFWVPLLFIAVPSFFIKIIDLIMISCMKYWYILLFWFTATSPMYIFFLMFFLDSQKKFQSFFVSMYRSVKMVLFNYPICWLFAMMFYVIEYASEIAIYWAAPESLPLGYKTIVGLLLWLVGRLLASIPICVFANIYIKKIHEQFDIYFTQPK